MQNQNRSLMTKQFTCFAQLFAACSAVVLLQHDHILVLRYAGVDMVHGAIAVKGRLLLVPLPEQLVPDKTPSR